MKRLLDAQGSTLRIFHYDELEDRAIIQVHNPDVDPVLNHNQRLANDGTKGDFEGKWGRRIASIPLNIANEWRAEMLKLGIFWDRKAKSQFLRRKLNDSEFRKLRTSPGTF